MKRSMSLYLAGCGACGGCAAEALALATPAYDIERLGISFVDTPREADCLVVAGCVTRQSAPRLAELVVGTPEPRICVVVGACGISGGVFAGAYHVAASAEEVIRSADAKAQIILVPGCPPRPEAVAKALLGAGDLLDEAAGGV